MASLCYTSAKVVYSHNITLDEEAEQLLARRLVECEGNVSKAMRSFIIASADSGRRYRQQLRPHLDVMNRKLGMLRRQRIAGDGFVLEEMSSALGRVEETIAKVGTA